MIAACLIGMSCAAGAIELPVAERPILHEGDVFEYVDRFQTIACRRWEVVGRQNDAIVSRCGDNLAFFAADSGALLRIAGTDGRALVTFAPFAPAIPFPLQVGSRWGGQFKVTSAGDLVAPELDESCEVKDFEPVRVAAGSLDAFRFECVTRWSVWPLHGSVTVTGWYAPAAKSVVKSINPSDSSWNLELAAYRLQ
jgi:hypothetical protein